jgi:hypothetical protein
MMRSSILLVPAACLAFAQPANANSAYQGMVAQHAAANGLPVSLVHRVIMRESRYNPRAVSKGNFGIMQIRLGTARAMGYNGSAAGLLDPHTNMTYAVKYLAGAYRAAGGNSDRAVSYYARGYYYQAKAQGFSPYGSGAVATAAAPSAAAALMNPFTSLAAAPGGVDHLPAVAPAVVPQRASRGAVVASPAPFGLFAAATPGEPVVVQRRRGRTVALVPVAAPETFAAVSEQPELVRVSRRRVRVVSAAPLDPLGLFAAATIEPERRHRRHRRAR